MLIIRMQRIGRRHDPSYRIVVTEHTSAPQSGKYVEKLGSYNPKTKAVTLADDRVKYWISVGAQASDTVHNFLIKRGVITGKTRNALPKKTPIKKEGEAAPEVAAAAPAEAVPAE